VSTATAEWSKAMTEDTPESIAAAWETLYHEVGKETVYLEGQAGTGSRYIVTGSLLPHDNGAGRHQIVVVQPWQASVIWGGGWQVSEYDIERYLTGNRRSEHRGDTYAIQYAVNRVVRDLEELEVG
jgi:hypothetical protein